MTICADKRRKIELRAREYINILVSLWRMLSDKEYYILCLGALIKSNLIFLTTQCSKNLNPFKDVGILTGMNNPLDTPERILNGPQPLRKNSEFTILVVSIST